MQGFGYPLDETANEFQTALSFLGIQPLPEIVGTCTRAEVDQTFEHVRLLIPKFRDVITNNKERCHISIKRLAPKFTLTPKILSAKAWIWEEMGKRFASKASVELLLQGEELNMKLMTEIECHLRESTTPKIALIAALERLVRSNLMPLISSGNEPSKESVDPAPHADPILMDPAALKQFASPKAQTIVVRIRDAPRLVGHRGRGLRRMLPNPACSLRVLKDDEGLNTLLQVKADAPESMMTLLWSETLRRLAVINGNINLKRQDHQVFEQHRLRFKHDVDMG